MIASYFLFVQSAIYLNELDVNDAAALQVHQGVAAQFATVPCHRK